MESFLVGFRNSLLQHVMNRRIGCPASDFGCVPSELTNQPLRSFVENNGLLKEWIFHCVPRVRNGFRFGIGCDPKPIDEINSIYGDDGAIPHLVQQGIFIFAEDGSGYPYCFDGNSGAVFRSWGAWGGGNEKELADVIDEKWDSLVEFTSWLKATFDQAKMP